MEQSGALIKMSTMKNLSWILIITCLCFAACESDTKSSTEVKPNAQATNLKIPTFSADTAYNYVAKQVDFGPRVPGTNEHQACKQWLVSQFESFGAEVIEQDFEANIYTGESLASTNIIAQINPKHAKRIILAAHWDSRMIGDQDPNEERRNEPILGADDGGSGVAVLLEIARLVKDNPINMGIDFILFDAEDQGKSGPSAPLNSWCLGSQYWSRNKHRKNYKPIYGILLDMVGAKNPVFGQDDYSLKFCGSKVKKIWTLAQNMGYGDLFVNKRIGEIVDDHVYVNELAKIPMLDIINTPKKKFSEGNNTFQKCWHTHCDDLSVIDKRSLRVVGQVVTATIYKESIGNL